MITNLLATVVTVFTTNTIERFPQHFVQGAITWPQSGYYENDRYPDRKWVRTTIKRVTTTTFEMNGKTFPTQDVEVVSDVEVEYAVKRTEVWTATGTNNLSAEYSLTNAPMWLITTNGIWATNLYKPTNWWNIRECVITGTNGTEKGKP